MNLPDLHTAEYAAIASYLAILVAGSLAWRQLRHTQRVHREQSRPYVIIDFEFRSFLVYLTVRNIGKTIARDVTITFDTKLESALGDQSGIHESSIFREPLPMMAPGRKISVLFDSYIERSSRDDLPKRYSVQIEYKDSEGNKFKDPPYPLDLAMYEHSSLEPKGIPELVSELHEIRGTMKKWTSGIRGLRVYTTDFHRNEARTVRPFIRRQAAKVRQDEGVRGYARWLVDRKLREYGWRR